MVFNLRNKMIAISLSGVDESAYVYMKSLKHSFFTKALLLFNTSWDKPNIQSNFFNKCSLTFNKVKYVSINISQGTLQVSP